MPATTPEQVHELWTNAFKAADRDALLDLYESSAVLAPAPDEVHEGHEAIGAALDAFLGLKPTFDMNLVQVVKAGDLAILYSRWDLVGTDPNGSEVRMGGVTSDVVRQQADGHWLMAIDNPFGGNVAATAAVD